MPAQDVETGIRQRIIEIIEGAEESNTFCGIVKPISQDNNSINDFDIFICKTSDDVVHYSGDATLDVTANCTITVRMNSEDYQSLDQITRDIFDALHLKPFGVFYEVRADLYSRPVPIRHINGIFLTQIIKITVYYDTEGSSGNPNVPETEASGNLSGTYPGPSVVGITDEEGNSYNITTIDDGLLQIVGNELTSISFDDAREELGLGTAATKDIPVSGNASTSQVVMGNDTRLSDARAPTGNASGDLSGTYNGAGPKVVSLTLEDGVTSIPIGNITSGQALVLSGGKIQGSSGFTPTSRTITGDSPIKVNGVNTPVDFQSDMTLSHGNSGVTAGTYGDNGTYSVISIDTKGHITIASNIRMLDHTVVWRTLSNYPQWTTSNIGAAVDATPTDNNVFVQAVEFFVGGTNTTASKRLGSSPKIRWNNIGIVTIWALYPAAIPSSGNTIVVWGMTNAFGSGVALPANGCYFCFLSTTSATKVLCVTSNSGATTVTITNVDFTIDQMRRYKIDMLKDRSACLFYIDDQLVATHTTNLVSDTTTLSNQQYELRTLAVAASLGIGIGETINYYYT